MEMGRHRGPAEARVRPRGNPRREGHRSRSRKAQNASVYPPMGRPSTMRVGRRHSTTVEPCRGWTRLVMPLCDGLPAGPMRMRRMRAPIVLGAAHRGPSAPTHGALRSRRLSAPMSARMSTLARLSLIAGSPHAPENPIRLNYASPGLRSQPTSSCVLDGQVFAAAVDAQGVGLLCRRNL